MLAGTLNSNHRVVIPMAGPPERKWRTLRKIAPPQETPLAEEVALSSDAENLPETGAGNPPAPDEPGSKDPVSVLVVHPVASTARLIRETLESFTDARVVTTSDPLRAFELALQQPHALYLFGMQIGELGGPMLYELVCRACTAGRGPRRVAAGVIFIREKDGPPLPEGLERDVRVKDVVSKPIRIDRLLRAVSGALEVRDPTVG